MTVYQLLKLLLELRQTGRMRQTFLSLYVKNLSNMLYVSYTVCFNPLLPHENRRATDHCTAIPWLVHWPLMGGLLHLVQRGGAWAGSLYQM